MCNIARFNPVLGDDFPGASDHVTVNEAHAHQMLHAHRDAADRL